MLPEQASDPVILAAVTLAVAAVLHYQKGLTYAEYRSVHRVKKRVFPVLDRMEPYGYGHFIHEKGSVMDPEYCGTFDGTVRELWTEMQDRGGSPHLVSSLKARPGGYSDLHFVWSHEDGAQSEVYCFANENGTVDVYAHLETGVTDVEGHLSDGVQAGDVRGVVEGVV